MVEMGVGERVRGDLPADELPREAAAAPSNTGVHDDRAQQVDVEGAAGAAAGQVQAGSQLVKSRGTLTHYLETVATGSGPCSR